MSERIVQLTRNILFLNYVRNDRYKKATGQPIGFASHICRSQPLAFTLVLFKGKKKGRHTWLIATSLPRTKYLGKKIVAIYHLRMQIEEEFRDIKSSLFGLGFEHHKSRYVQRMTILILIATLASILANIIGLAMFMAGLHLRYQANTVKKGAYYHFTIWACEVM